MKEPKALASSAKNFQVVAPIGYGSEGPYCLPSALFGYFVTALPLYHCLLKKNVRDASSETRHNLANYLAQLVLT